MSVITVLIGVFAGATVVCADITRHSPSRKGTVMSTFVGFFPSAILFIIIGAVLGLGSGTGDISQVFVGLNMPLFGVLAMLLATWTTNVTNGYSAGLAITRLFGFNEDRRWVGTLIAGIIGIGLAIAGINITTFYGFMATVTPPIAGVMVADYWIVGRGKKENWGIRNGFNWTGIAAALTGALIGFLFPTFLNKAINSIVVAIVAFTIYHKIGEKTNSIPALENFD